MYKTFAACRYLALTASVKFVLVVQKQLGMNKFVRTKSHTESKFSEIFFEHFIQDGLWLCTYIAVFLCGVR